MLLPLYAKRELYFALAVKVAPLEDLGADNNNYIKRDQRFQHYIKLIGQVDDEISGFLNDGDGAGGGGGTNGYVLTYNTTLVDRYATAYNYRALKPPTVSIVVSGITPHSVEIAWKTSYISKFLNYRVWAGKESIYDPYTEAKISEGIKPIFFSRDPHSSMVRITDLEPNTNYYFVVGATNASDLTGYTQTLVTTLEEVIP